MRSEWSLPEEKEHKLPAFIHFGRVQWYRRHGVCLALLDAFEFQYHSFSVKLINIWPSNYELSLVFSRHFLFIFKFYVILQCLPDWESQNYSEKRPPIKYLLIFRSPHQKLTIGMIFFLPLVYNLRTRLHQRWLTYQSVKNDVIF